MKYTSGNEDEKASVNRNTATANAAHPPPHLIDAAARQYIKQTSYHRTTAEREMWRREKTPHGAS